MLKFKTFDVIMLLLQMVANVIVVYWAFKNIGKSKVFLHIASFGTVQCVFTLVASL